MTAPETADRLTAALAAAQQNGNPVLGDDPARWLRIARIATHRWATFPRRHPGPAADTLACRTEDLARGLLDRCGRSDGNSGPPSISAYRALAARLAQVLRSASIPSRP